MHLFILGGIIHPLNPLHSLFVQDVFEMRFAKMPDEPMIMATPALAPTPMMPQPPPPPPIIFSESESESESEGDSDHERTQRLAELQEQVELVCLFVCLFSPRFGCKF